MLGEVLGVERRRRWSDEEKLEILLEVGAGGASVTQVAQRHELTRSQIYGTCSFTGVSSANRAGPARTSLPICSARGS
ncbi:MAG: transposase, partial [Rhodobacteraceae bacterium]|nr:transposase [Paracoccaceae bacterium]